MPLTTGTRLGPYELSDLIGAGGMGEVYKTRDTRLNRDVAIKILPASFAADPAPAAYDPIEVGDVLLLGVVDEHQVK